MAIRNSLIINIAIFAVFDTSQIFEKKNFWVACPLKNLISPKTPRTLLDMPINILIERELRYFDVQLKILTS